MGVTGTSDRGKGHKARPTRIGKLKNYPGQSLFRGGVRPEGSKR